MGAKGGGIMWVWFYSIDSDGNELLEAFREVVEDEIELYYLTDKDVVFWDEHDTLCMVEWEEEE